MEDMFFNDGMLFSFSNIFFVFFFLIFFTFILLFIISMIKGIRQWRKNEQAPELSVPAMVKTKRTDIHRHSHGHDDNRMFFF
ncbi:DUF2500 family protein [Fervidibacillus halotolerans]|uniref:DUF2500 family protein n=1 Tax=Fervidibacillus halotolerans TaxID=2980027 RepID=UPI003084274B